jgi:hypothetical protein
MKKIVLSILLLGAAFAKAQESPTEFYNSIIEEQNKVVKKSTHYTSVAVHSENDAEVDRARKDVIRQIEKSIEAVKLIKPFKGDGKLKDEALAILKRELDAYTLDFNEAAILKKSSKATFEAMEKYYVTQDKAEAKIDAAMDDFKKSQLRFADKYNFTIQENEESKKQSEKLSRLNKYTRTVFLPYFKAFRDFNLFVDAYNVGKAPQMETARQTMLKSSTESLAQMKTLGGFEGDAGYVNAGIKLLEYYKKMAEGDLAELCKIMVNKDKLTKEQADRANKILEGMNDAPNKMNEAFNQENKKLLQKHIPKE